MVRTWTVVGLGYAVAAALVVFGSRGAALEISSSIPHLELARVYASHGRFEDAQRLCAEVLSRDQDSTTARLALASSCYKAGDFDRAMDQYVDLLEYGADSPIVLFNMGQTLRRLGKQEEAVASFGELSEIYGSLLPGLCSEAHSIVSAMVAVPPAGDGACQEAE